MYQVNGTKRVKRCSSMSDSEDGQSSVIRVEENPEHGMKVLKGLNQLMKDKVLCDVTLIAEGNGFSINA